MRKFVCIMMAIITLSVFSGCSSRLKDGANGTGASSLGQSDSNISSEEKDDLSESKQENTASSSAPTKDEAILISTNLLDSANTLLNYLTDSSGDIITLAGIDYIKVGNYSSIQDFIDVFHSVFSSIVFKDTQLSNLNSWTEKYFISYQGGIYRNTMVDFPSLTQKWYTDKTSEYILTESGFCLTMMAGREIEEFKSLFVVFENDRWLLDSSYFDYAS